MTIEEIVEREMVRQGVQEVSIAASHSMQVISEECARAACRSVAKAVVEACAKAIEPLKIRREIARGHQPSVWRNSALEMAEEQILALAAQGTGGDVIMCGDLDGTKGVCVLPRDHGSRHRYEKVRPA